MLVSGFTFVRNAIRYDYPVVEAIRSMLPLCDQVVVAVGRSEDDTLGLIQGIGDPKIKIIETVWDDRLREGGNVLAEETNKAFDAIGAEYDWCFYLQGDECIHENDYSAIRQGMATYLNDPQTQGLLFQYRHFYGTYDYIGLSRRWYRREVRIIRNDKRIRSYRDAQGFRIDGAAKLRVRLLPAHIYHYGWVKHPETQQRKQQDFNKLWHPDEWIEQHVGAAPSYRYDGTEPLARFQGTHPAVMLPRIKAAQWHFDQDPTQIKWPWKDRASRWLEQKTGWRPGEYRNYRLIGK